MSDFGVILIDKPPDITSFDVVRKLRKITGIRKIGHTGTLDPFATGLMQLCIGKATRVVSKLTEEDKTYIAFTGSNVLIEQLNKYESNIPFYTTIKKINKYYTFS